MSRQFWNEALAWVTTAGTPIATSTTETALFAAVTIPANYLADGRVLRLRAFGAYGTTGTPTLILAAKFGSSDIAKSGAITTGSAVGGGASMTALWSVEFMLQVRTNGSSGTIFTNGEVTLYSTGTVAGSSFPIASGTTGGTTPVAATADLTADTALSITATWGTSNAANSIRGDIMTIEALN
jgi:hypothetical protein